MTLKLFRGDQSQPNMNYSKLFAKVDDDESYMFDIKWIYVLNNYGVWKNLFNL